MKCLVCGQVTKTYVENGGKCKDCILSVRDRLEWFPFMPAIQKRVFNWAHNPLTNRNDLIVVEREL